MYELPEIQVRTQTLKQAESMECQIRAGEFSGPGSAGIKVEHFLYG